MTSYKEFMSPIAEIIEEMGGSGTTSEILERLGNTYDSFDEEDLTVKNGKPKWMYTARWARYYLVKDGTLKDDSDRGVWELSKLTEKEVVDDRPADEVIPTVKKKKKGFWTRLLGK